MERSRSWATQILTQVPDRAHFVLLLTPNAFDRCADEGDWVRREFLRAVETRRNIVLVAEEFHISAKWNSGDFPAGSAPIIEAE